MTRLRMVLVLLGALTLGGCARYTIYQTTQSGQVYVVQRVRSDAVYSCDARNGRPICYRTQEIRLP